LKTRQAVLHTSEKIEYYPDQVLGQGVEKEFFAATDPDVVLGFYKDTKGWEDPERIKRLSKIVHNYNPGKDAEQKKYWDLFFSWPAAIIKEPTPGILCPRFPKNYYFDDIESEKKAKWFFTRNLTQKTGDGQNFNLLKRLQVCRHLCEALTRMHMAGLCHSDLSGNNILMDPASETCIIIDIDSLVVPGLLPAKVIGTKGYSAPEVVAATNLPLNHPDKKMPTISTDLHALAVIIYETLLMRHPLAGKKVHSKDPEEDDFFLYGEKALFIEDPKDNSNRPDYLKYPVDALGSDLHQLFIKAFSKGLHNPFQRPTAMEWEKALTKTMDRLHPCRGKQCFHKWFVFRQDHPPICPECETRISHPIPVMPLFDRVKNGQYFFSGHYITIFDQKKIYPRHTCTGQPFKDDAIDEKSTRGQFTLSENRWQFKNDKNEKKICFPFLNMTADSAIEITNGQMILLNSSPRGRVGMITFNTN